MMLLWFTVAVAFVAQSRGENLASCANTDCGDKVCRIIERCWSNDCQVGTMCINASEEPVSSGTCLYEKPLLKSQDGGAVSEMKCTSASATIECPPGTMCNDVAGVCCTGATKNVGACPAKTDNYYLSHGECKVFCQHDQDCPGFERCCDTETRCRTCMKPAPLSNCLDHPPCPDGQHCVMKPTNCTQYPCFSQPECTWDHAGQCPMLPIQASCADQCKVDSHCPLDKKCCSAGGCSVCVTPGAPTTVPPTPNFNGGFGGLGGGGGGGTGDGSAFGASGPTTTPQPSSASGSSFPNMSGFLDSSNSGSGGLAMSGFGDGSSSPFSSLSSSSSSSPSMDLSSSSSTGSGDSNPFSSMLNSMTGMQSGGTSSGSTNPLSSMMDAMKTIQSGGSTAANAMTNMMDTFKQMQSGGSSVSGSTSVTSMLSNVQDMMKNLNSGGSAPSLGGTSGSTNPFGSMLNNLNNFNGLNSLNNLNSNPSGSSSGSPLNPLSSLSGFGSSGGGGLDPVISGNTLNSIGGGGLSPMGNGGRGGGGLAPGSGLRPQLPNLGGRSHRTNQGQQRGSRNSCPMCWMFMAMFN